MPIVLTSLKNKKIIISAGASGIGLATAKICLARGAYVYLCDIDSKSLNKLNKHPLKNKRLFAYLCDASNEYQVSDFFEKIKKRTKKIDALINNVGIAGPTGSLEKLKSKDWENTLHIDINSHFYFTKKAIPLIKKSKALSKGNRFNKTPKQASKAIVPGKAKSNSSFLNSMFIGSCIELTISITPSKRPTFNAL